MTELAKNKVASRQEVVIPITLRGLVKGLRIICFDKPVEYTGIIADHAERLSQRMMAGRAAIMTMPAGIILRNASRTVLGSTSEERSAWWGAFSNLSGTVGAAGALYLSAKAMAGVFGGSIVGATVGTWGSWALGAIVSAPVVLPAFGAAFLAGTVVAAAAVAALSVVPAVANIGVAIKRSLDGWKGIKYDNSVLQSDKSLSDKLRDRRENKIISEFYGLPRHKTEQVYEYLTQQRGYGATSEQLLAILDDKQQLAMHGALSEKFGAATTRSDVAAAPAAAPAKAPKPKGN